VDDLVPGRSDLSGSQQVRPFVTDPRIRAAMWRFTRNNGITEGFHNKMELINRQAYGFRNFENYRMRVQELFA